MDDAIYRGSRHRKQQVLDILRIPGRGPVGQQRNRDRHYEPTPHTVTLIAYEKTSGSVNAPGTTCFPNFLNPAVNKTPSSLRNTRKLMIFFDSELLNVDSTAKHGGQCTPLVGRIRG